MITVQAINNTAGTLTYSSESITIPGNSTVTVSNLVLTAFSLDPSVISDIKVDNLRLSDTVNTYTGDAALQFLNNSAENLDRLDKLGSGTISSLNGTVIATTNGASTVVFGVSGTWVATIFFKGVREDGAFEYLYANQVQFGSDLTFQNYSTIGTYVVNCAGFSSVEVIAGAYTSGTINVGWISSVGTNLLKVYQPTASSLQSTARLNDGSGNSVTSTSISGTGSNKQALDINSLPSATTRYFTGFSIQQSATTAANATIFSMRNSATSTKTIIIENITCRQGFNATNPVTRTQQQYIFQRFSASTPTGGTALTAGQGDSSDSASQVTDIRFVDTGLTTTGVTFVTNNLGVMACDTTQGINADRVILDPPRGWKLAPGEGLCIRLGVVAVVGTTFSCNIGWREQ